MEAAKGKPSSLRFDASSPSSLRFDASRPRSEEQRAWSGSEAQMARSMEHGPDPGAGVPTLRGVQA